MLRLAVINGRDVADAGARRLGLGTVGISVLALGLLSIGLALPTAADDGQQGYVTAIALNLRNAPGIICG